MIWYIPIALGTALALTAGISLVVWLAGVREGDKSRFPLQRRK